MEVLVIITLTLNIWACSGFPVYDYDPAMMREALKASLEKVNSQSQNPNLFRAYKSSVRRSHLNPVARQSSEQLKMAQDTTGDLDPFRLRPFQVLTLSEVNFMNENDLTMDIDFKIRETECRKASENPPSTCDFKIGYYASTASCRSTVEISTGQVQNVWVRCHHAFSSSESSSSEEIFGGRLGSYNWRNYYMRDVGNDEYRNGPLYQRSLGIGDVEVFPPQSRRLQNDWNRYRAFE